MLKTTLTCSAMALLFFVSCVKNNKNNSSKLATIDIPSFDFEYDKLDLKVSKDAGMPVATHSIKKGEQSSVSLKTGVYEFNIDIYKNSKAAVYVGIYFQTPPKKSDKKYVVFSNNTIKTSIL